MMKVGVIYARSLNNVIGNNGKLPWHLPEDLKHFKETTQGCVVAMGKKTWESLPIKPLPNRENLVLTSSPLYHPEVTTSRSILEATNEAFYRKKDIWFIGGSNVIKKALRVADTVIVTEILNNYEGDTTVEELADEWKIITKTSHRSVTGINFNILKYERSGNYVSTNTC